MTLLLILNACNACSACRPQLPPSPDDPPIQDTSPPPEDSGDSGDSAPPDSGPPARCDVEETEPNETLDEAQLLPMEQWACGNFQRVLDADWLTFTTAETGWIEIAVEAAARGSNANAQLQVVGADGTSTLSMDGYLSTDPRVVFPANEPGTWSVAVSDSFRNYGENFDWFLMASIVKQPVIWSFEEIEDNDALASAQPFVPGDTVFGRIEAAGDLDWYHVVLPEGEDTLTFDVEAFSQGSVANTKIVLYAADGTTILRTDYRGEIDYDPDPWFEQRVVGPTDWYVLVRTEDDRGSPYHWYTLHISSRNAPQR